MTDHPLKKLPKAALFDWDSTLADSLQIVHKAVTHAFEKHNGPTWSVDDTKVNIHQSYKTYLSKLFPDNWQEVVDTYRQHYLSLSPELQAFPAAAEVLAHLKQKGVFIGLISNKKAFVLRDEVKRFGWEHYFDRVIGSGDVAEDKPHPIAVQTIFEGSNIRPDMHEVWFVGDSVTDMETAHNSGCVPVFFGDDDHLDQRYAHCRPKCHFATHEELLVHLLKLG